MEEVILYTDSQDVQVTCSSAAISIYSTVHTTLSDDDDDDDDSSPVAGCLARADRAVWAQSTSWRWATRAHNSTRRIWQRAAAGTDTRRSISGGRSRNLDLWLWSTGGTWRPVRPGTAAGPSRLRSARSRHTLKLWATGTKSPYWSLEPLTPTTDWSPLHCDRCKPQPIGWNDRGGVAAWQTASRSLVKRATVGNSRAAASLSVNQSQRAEAVTPCAQSAWLCYGSVTTLSTSAIQKSEQRIKTHLSQQFDTGSLCLLSTGARGCKESRKTFLKN